MAGSKIGRLANSIFKGFEDEVGHLGYSGVKNIIKENGFKTEGEVLSHIRGLNKTTERVARDVPINSGTLKTAAGEGRLNIPTQEQLNIEKVKNAEMDQWFNSEDMDYHMEDQEIRTEEIEKSKPFDNRPKHAKEQQEAVERKQKLEEERKRQEAVKNAGKESSGNQTQNSSGKNDPHEDAKIFDIKGKFEGKAGYATKNDQQTANDIFEMTDTEKIKKKLGGFGFAGEGAEAKIDSYIKAGANERKQILEDHVSSRKGRELSWGETMGYHKVPQKAAAVGATAWLVSSMSSSKGQQSNGELYGQQTPYR